MIKIELKFIKKKKISSLENVTNWYRIFQANRFKTTKTKEKLMCFPSLYLI